MQSQSVGISKTRLDGVEKVTGGALFTADMCFPGMLYMKVLRSPYAHARIKSISAVAAQAAAGVVKVITGEDVPGPFGVAIQDQYPIARKKVRFAGEPVAAVIAFSEKAAHNACKLIQVEYEPLPFVISPQAAIADGAPVLHEDLMSYQCAPYVRPVGGNLYQHFQVRKGNSEQPLAHSVHTVEGEYHFPYVQHVQMEPHCAIAKYEKNNSMVMYASTQAPFVVQDCVHELLSIPKSSVQVVAPYLGGGFGGKSDITIEALVACAAKAVPGRFVRLLLTREEVFTGSSLGRGGFCKYRIGFDADGMITGMKGECYLGSGGNADYAVNIITGMAHSGTGPYFVPNLSLDVYGVYTNTPPIGATRGYGHPEVHLAVECLMDAAAEKLGISPAQIRLKNHLREGAANGIGQVMTSHSGDFLRCTEQTTQQLFQGEKRQVCENISVGRGLGAYMKTPCMPSNVQSGAMLKLNSDGTVTLSVGAIEMGQGTYTALAQIAAQALGLPFEKISVNAKVDTLISPYEWQTVASHTTWGVGNAILIAAENLRRKLKEEAAKFFGSAADTVELQNGKAVCMGKEIPWEELALGLRDESGKAVTSPIMGEGYFCAQGIQNPNIETGQSNAAADWTMGCVGVELGVDKATGEVFLYRLINTIDAGTIINPAIAHDQVVGGMLMSVGSALSETLVFDEKRGNIRNNNLVDYKIPGIEDMPEEISIRFIETPEESGPFGAKGIGEHGAVATAPAILNAIYDATGIRFSSLPVSAATLKAALLVRQDEMTDGGGHG